MFAVVFKVGCCSTWVHHFDLVQCIQILWLCMLAGFEVHAQRDSNSTPSKAAVLTLCVGADYVPHWQHVLSHLG